MPVPLRDDTANMVIGYTMELTIECVPTHSIEKIMKIVCTVITAKLIMMLVNIALHENTHVYY